MDQAVDRVKYPPFTPEQEASWLVSIQVGERASTAYAPDWLSARKAMGDAVVAMFKAGLLVEFSTNFVLESLRDAKNPSVHSHEGTRMGCWYATSAEPFWMFRIHAPLGMGFNQESK